VDGIAVKPEGKSSPARPKARYTILGKLWRARYAVPLDRSGLPKTSVFGTLENIDSDHVVSISYSSLRRGVF